MPSPSSYDDITEKIIENNQDLKFETVLKSNDKKKRFLEGKKGNHVSFFVDPEDYISDKKNRKVVCVKCTDTFFNIFFKDAKDENDEIMEEIFKSKVYMDYIPSEKIYRCRNNPEHVELSRDPQIEGRPKEKQILGAGIEQFPEYVSYLDPDSMTGDFIVTANIGRKKTERSRKPFFHEKTDEEIFNNYMNSKQS